MNNLGGAIKFRGVWPYRKSIDGIFGVLVSGFKGPPFSHFFIKYGPYSMGDQSTITSKS